MSVATIERVEFKPQPRQEEFLSSPADIAIYGGAAGGGKTWALLLEPLRHVHNPEFGAVIFRRTVPEIVNEGGLWDESGRIYPWLGSAPNQNEHQHVFPSGARVTFSHLQYETDLVGWRSTQIPLIGFDQLETFTERMFFYLLSRNRSMCGVRPYVRATVNPEPGWLADFLSWWIADDGYADMERSGALRWMIRSGADVIEWADTKEELLARFPGSLPKSVTFVVSTVFDNPILLEKDPGYLANLNALPYVDRERLLGDAVRGGNWKVVPAAGKIFNRDWFDIVPMLPAGRVKFARFWDLAASAKTMGSVSKHKQKSRDPDYTASVKMAAFPGQTVVMDYTSDRIGPAATDELILAMARNDGKDVAIRWEQEPGASGVRDSHHLVTLLRGFDAAGVPSQGDKIVRAKGLAAQARVGNVKLLRGAWNEAWLQHMHGQPDLPHDDGMDASSGAFNALTVLGIPLTPQPEQKSRFEEAGSGLKYQGGSRWKGVK